jgi:DNA polymerase
MMKMCKPRKATKNDLSEWHESPEDFEKLYEYCIDDVECERAIDRALPELSETEQQVWELDQEMNMNGIRVDLELVEKALSFASVYSDKLNKRLHDLTEGYVDKHTKRAAFLRWLAMNDVELPDFTAPTVRYALAKMDLPAVVREALDIKVALAKSSVSKYEAFKNSTCDDGRLRDILVYHSASTGRWGGKIVQLQNLPRGNEKYTDAAAACIKQLSLEDFEKVYPNVMGTLSSCIRSVLIPDVGRGMSVADYSSIEARVIAWLAEQEDTLNVFRSGECVYCNEATGIFGRLITKKDKFERSIGKVAVLALGFAGGIGAFGTMANAYEMDLEPVYDIVYPSISGYEYDSAEWAYNFYKSRVESPLSHKAGVVSDIIKQRWRANNPKIVEYWKNIENAAIEAVKNKGALYTVNNVKFLYPNGHQFLYCALPSGRKLAYHRPEIKESGSKEQLTYMTLHSQTKKYLRTSGYGGKLVENIVQAVARDIMAHGLLNIKRDGRYLPHLTVHDEAITSGAKEEDIKVLERLMCDLPEWAAGLPIEAEGWKGIRYKKA